MPAGPSEVTRGGVLRHRGTCQGLPAWVRRHAWGPTGACRRECAEVPRGLLGVTGGRFAAVPGGPLGVVGGGVPRHLRSHQGSPEGLRQATQGPSGGLQRGCAEMPRDPPGVTGGGVLRRCGLPAGVRSCTRGPTRGCQWGCAEVPGDTSGGAGCHPPPHPGAPWGLPVGVH